MVLDIRIYIHMNVEDQIFPLIKKNAWLLPVPTTAAAKDAVHFTAALCKLSKPFALDENLIWSFQDGWTDDGWTHN